MLLAVVDDLMFTSKIRAAAGQLGVPLVFARTADSAMAEAKRSLPKLVILDLDNPRTDPIGIITGLKSDPSLAGIHVVGFASHVKVELIRAAREAGADDVLPRSAFTMQLADILAVAR
jgi:CheY-like chemotaxis protein